jgi:hypothetical protein
MAHRKTGEVEGIDGEPKNGRPLEGKNGDSTTMGVINMSAAANASTAPRIASRTCLPMR